jgi:hypothetical protein
VGIEYNDLQAHWTPEQGTVNTWSQGEIAIVRRGYAIGHMCATLTWEDFGMELNWMGRPLGSARED